MSSFKGSYRYSVDNKGRINIPAKLRKYLSPESNDIFVVTRGYDPCLFLYPLDEWARVEQSIRELSSTNPHHRFLTRVLCQHATEAALDAQSRIAIPHELLELAGLGTEVFILGVLNRIELWNPARYDEYLKAQADSYEAIAEMIFEQKRI